MKLRVVVGEHCRVRWLFVLAIIGCADPDECQGPLGSDFVHHPRAIASATSGFIGAAWLRKHNTDVFEPKEPTTIRAAIVFEDGSMSPDAEIASTADRGIVGTRTVLWHDSFEPVVTLQAIDGSVRSVPIRQETHGHDIVFDGQRYQVFTFTQHVVTHRTLEEDGTLGPEQMLTGGSTSHCSYPTSHGGRTFLLCDDTIYSVDTTLGTIARAFDVGPDVVVGDIFWFADELHIRDGGRLFSYKETGESRTRFLPDNPTHLVPAADKLLVVTESAILELDATLATLRGHARTSSPRVGSFGSDVVQFERHPIDVDTRTPGSLDVLRTNAWRSTLAVDTQPYSKKISCDRIVRQDYGASVIR